MKIKTLVLSLVFVSKGYCGIFPFPDPMDSLAKMKEIAILLNTYHELQNHGKQLARQIDGAIDIKNTFDRKMEESHRLMSGDFKFAARHYVEGLDRWERKFQSWDSLIKTKGRRFKSTTRKSSELEEERFEELSSTNQATDEVATQTYNDVDREIEVLEKLKKDMNEATTQKAITELVARINIQKAIIQAKNNRLSAVQAKLATANAEQHLKEAKWADNFLRFK